MPNLFQKLAIRQKLIVIMTAASLITLLLAFAGFSVLNITVFVQNQKNKMRILAHVIAENSQAALSFNDSQAAADVLASLRAEPHIVSAAVYDRLGRLFAQYRSEELPELPEAGIAALSQIFKKSRLDVYQPVLLRGENIGLIFLQADRRELDALIFNYFILGFIILFVAGLAAVAVSSRMQHTISRPVTALTQVAEAVSATKDYSLRAVKESGDELGNLVDRFNEMLTEIQLREEALLRSNEALKRSNRDLEQFAYVASHDLQEPLRMVINYVDLILMNQTRPGDSQTKEYMEFILEGAMRSKQLIEDLLQYSRLYNEGMKRRMPGEVLLNKALANLHYAVEAAGAVITHDPLPEIWGDEIKLVQLLQNLVGNAVKFRGIEPPRIHIGVVQEDSRWLFSVKDNGIGISPEYAERIFVIFKRLHTREAYAGTGIGLALCKRIVEQHGGKIWVESQPGRGSTFYFTLPAL